MRKNLTTRLLLFRLQRDSEFPVELVQWAEVCILVYAVDDRRSFETARRLLQRLTRQRAAAAPNNDKPVFALIGNKADLEHLRTVSSHSHSLAWSAKVFIGILFAKFCKIFNIYCARKH
jgi:hypothetical protein